MTSSSDAATQPTSGSDDEQFGSLRYLDLGVGVHCGEDETLSGYEIIFADEDSEYQPYGGTVSWLGKSLDFELLSGDLLSGEQPSSVFGDCYWMDTDESESIAFYEFPNYEIQIEISLSGAIKRVNVTQQPLMAEPEQRASYKVDKPWPPQFDA